MHSKKDVQVIDWSVALSHVDGDRELLKELAAMFMDDYHHFLDELKESILKCDYSTLERVAHTLKGRLAFLAYKMV
jgi:HPt (histidine-containing phosphotransfer) domain-containing protein